MSLSAPVADWERRGTYRTCAGWRTFTVEIAPEGDERSEPLLVLHGFPTCSFDFHHVVDRLATHRRVLLLDMVGYGLSSKPDIAYTIDLQADVVEAFVADAGVATLALLTHDVGDTVGGELLARNAEGRWPVEITRRVITNGSIYIEMAHLTDGQNFLLELPDARLPDGTLDAAAISASLAATFSPSTPVDPVELGAAAELVTHEDGQLLLPRTIRYIEERRRNQARYTGAIERHPSGLTIVWGTDDPIAVPDMATRLHDARPGSHLTLLDGVGHYPMLEAPLAFGAAVASGLA